MKNSLKVMWKTVKVIFIVFFIFLLSLCFRQQRLPGKWVEYICARLSSADVVVTCDSASIGFRDGLHFLNLRAYDRSRLDNLRPVLSTESVSILPLIRRVRVVAAKMPRLHDGYYGLGTGAAETSSSAGLSEFEFPLVPDFTLELDRPEILGIAPERLVAWVSVEPRRLALEDVGIKWPDQDVPMGVDGSCTVDLINMKLTGEVHGTARQEHIRPLLVALDFPVAYPYMGGYPDTGTSGFTGVIGPVPAFCAWNVDLATREMKLDLELHPQMGRYNNVRLDRVDGRLGIHVYFTDSYMGYDVSVGPLVAVDHRGRQLSGSLVVHGTNNLDYLEFNASSGLEMQDTLDIMGYLNRGTFDFLRCATPARVTAKGIFNCNDVNIPNNDFGGRLEIDQGSLYKHDFKDLKLDYRLVGSEIFVSNMTAKSVSGGDFSGSASFHLPMAEGDERSYGRGSIKIENGKLVRIPLFFALTSALADNVPGLDRIVNQSEARCDYTVSNGVFRTDNLVVQGSLFCIRISGSCDFNKDELDMIAHCTIMKEESALGKYLIQPVLWPFTKLLTEFHVSGSTGDPVLSSTSMKTTGEIIKKVIGQ